LRGLANFSRGLASFLIGAAAVDGVNGVGVGGGTFEIDVAVDMDEMVWVAGAVIEVTTTDDKTTDDTTDSTGFVLITSVGPALDTGTY
jgi:hypothetical protein